MKRLLHWIHEAGAWLGILTTVVAVAGEGAHLWTPDVAVKVAAAGTLLAALGRALRTVEERLALAYPDKVAPETQRVAAAKAAESQPTVP